jgi:hypothetical protein
MWTAFDSIRSRYNGLRGHDDVPPDYINSIEFIDQVSDCQRLKMDSLPWGRWLFVFVLCLCS